MQIAWHAMVAWYQSALSGMAEACVIAVALVLTTLLLEDLAIAASVALVANGAISLGLSLTAVGVGIAAGDIGLYSAGVAATRVPWLRRRYIGDRSLWAQQQLVHRLPSAILLARAIPGLRLATYTACGFVRVPLGAFVAWVGLAVAMWTLGLYAISFAIGSALTLRLGVSAPVAVALPIVVLAAAFPLVRLTRQHYRQRARS